MPINMPVEFDEFKQLVQYVPAFIIKPQFNEKNINENVSVEHGVTVIKDYAKLSSVPFGITFDNLLNDNLLNDNLLDDERLLRRNCFHIHFHISPSFHSRIVKPDFNFYIDRNGRHYSHNQNIIARIPSEIHERGVINDERMYDCLHRVHERIRWYLHWIMVPFFVGVDYNTCVTIEKIPDPIMLAGWLEDYADSTFDSIKAEAYLTGAELLKNAHT